MNNYKTILMVVAIATIPFALNTPDSSALAKKSGKSLVQIPSTATDFPDNDPSPIQIHVTSAKKDVIGSYELNGEITNVGNDTLQFVHVTAHVFDGAGQLIGSGDGYTNPTNLDPQHTGTYNMFISGDSLSGKPVSYRLSFDWS